VAQWISHLEQKTRVRIPPEIKDFREIVSMLLCLINLICIVHLCVEREIKGFGQKVLKQDFEQNPFLIGSTKNIGLQHGRQMMAYFSNQK
jgi:hypothetical protein